MEIIMEKSNNSLYSYPPRALIMSHPRSGLHMLRIGLYLLEGGSDEYDYFWPRYNIAHSHHIDDGFINLDLKVILLIRNYHELISKMSNPRILKTYANLAPEKLKNLHPDINIGRATDTSLNDEDRFGSFGFVEHDYANLIRFYDSIPPHIPKKIIYYEDLLENNNTLLKVAEFLNIDYAKKNINVGNIKEKTKELYVKSNHFPSPPEGTFLNIESHMALQQDMKKSLVGPTLYNKYLQRYEGKYQ